MFCQAGFDQWRTISMLYLSSCEQASAHDVSQTQQTPVDQIDLAR